MPSRAVELTGKGSIFPKAPVDAGAFVLYVQSVDHIDIRGLVPFTTLDYPGKLACVMFCAGCNMRCPCCHNSHLVLDPARQEWIPLVEIVEFLVRRSGRLEGVVISGGEPTLQPGLAGFISRVRELGYLVRLDTNGSRPDVVSPLLSGGMIDSMAVDLKGSVDNYPAASGIADNLSSKVVETIRMAYSSKIELEVRTTVHRRLQSHGDLKSMRLLLDSIGVGGWVWQRYRKNSPIDPTLEEEDGWTSEEASMMASEIGRIELRGWEGAGE